MMNPAVSHVHDLSVLLRGSVPTQSFSALDDSLIDLSKATKLKDMEFGFQYLSIAWVASTLKTITSRHRDLQGVSIRGCDLSDSTGTGWQANAAAEEDDTREQWMDLERTLVQLWESHAVRAKVEYYSKTREESCELMEKLLPEATKRGVVELLRLQHVLMLADVPNNIICLYTPRVTYWSCVVL